jgi:hypothetical protein
MRRITAAAMFLNVCSMEVSRRIRMPVLCTFLPALATDCIGLIKRVIVQDTKRAGVAELVDAADSKSAASNGVGVRVSPPANVPNLSDVPRFNRN